MYFVITGDVKFEIIKNNKEKIAGLPYNVYVIENKDQIDIQSTNKSVYGYLSISENIVLDEIWDSVSINTKAKRQPIRSVRISAKLNILTCSHFYCLIYINSDHSGHSRFLHRNTH